MTPQEIQVIKLLIDVARKAFYHCDDTGLNTETGILEADEQSYEALSQALDSLDELPDDRPQYTMGPAAKAEWALRNLIGEPE